MWFEKLLVKNDTEYHLMRKDCYTCIRGLILNISPGDILHQISSIPPSAIWIKKFLSIVVYYDKTFGFD
jgi:hypothetical protein